MLWMMLETLLIFRPEILEFNTMYKITVTNILGFVSHYLDSGIEEVMSDSLYDGDWICVL